ncbi:VanZ family protein [Maribacter sp. ACAM166]|uniref:VanZ family protein n=1 Tax=Maribacter sp. ACAM166 TaxID=2508996 RepID=UPI00201776D3|nr:VanZ family protein [Maribacter sp. ACAM166]
MVLVTFFSLFSFSGVDTSRFNIPHMDKAVHFTFYFVMVILAFVAKTKGEWQGSNTLKLLWHITLFSILYGIVIEVLQHVATVNRHGDSLDVLANSTGAIVAMLLLRFLFLRKLSLK